MIRTATPSDARVMYEICLRTGDAGADASHLFADAQLLGDTYVGPYLHCRPAFALVAEDGPGAGVLGYVVGTPDTARFAEACEAGWWPGLRARHPNHRDRQGHVAAHRPPAEQVLVEHIHAPAGADAELVAEFPAHLHIDLLPEGQGRGLGRALMDRMLTSLAAAGAPGIHVGVDPRNTAAVAFYRHLGFFDWGRPAAGSTVLVRPLTSDAALSRGR